MKSIPCHILQCVALLIGVALLTSCASVHAPQVTASEVRAVNERNYELNKEQTRYTGDSIVRRRDYFSRTISAANVIKPDRDGTITAYRALASPWQVQFKKNDSLRVIGEVEHEGGKAKLTPVNSTHPPYSALIDSEGKLIDDTWCYSDPILGWVKGKFVKVRVEPAETRFFSSNSEQVDSSKPYTNYELVYTGKSAGSINILYREYSADDLARSSYYQNLVYEADTETIRFRNVRIKLLKATNESISYIVMQD